MWDEMDGIGVELGGKMGYEMCENGWDGLYVKWDRNCFRK